jgi:hypothetical protein
MPEFLGAFCIACRSALDRADARAANAFSTGHPRAGRFSAVKDATQAISLQPGADQ